MPESVIYAQMTKPAGILRILMGVMILVIAASTWQAQDKHTWAAAMMNLMIWVIPATLMWLLLLYPIVFLQRLPWMADHHPSRALQLFYRAYPIVLGTVCAGVCAGIGTFFNVDRPQSYMLSLWNWPSAISGALAATAITEWFYGRNQAKAPADTEAKLMELQARIRPHFLFNTLNSAIALVRLDPDAAEKVLQDLSTLFRAALESGESSSVTLQHEVDLAQSYIDIESVRLGERLRVQWQLDESILQAIVPALSLQPILENAIRHGVEPSPTGGIIHVLAKRYLGKVRVEVTNTMPSPEQQAPNSTQGHGMALPNLRARLSLMHDFEGVLKTKTMTDESGQHWFITSLEVPQK